LFYSRVPFFSAADEHRQKKTFAGGTERTRVRARSLFGFLAVRELGMSQVELSKLLKLSPAVLAFAVKRGELTHFLHCTKWVI
jgi:hypothetical protein